MVELDASRVDERATVGATVSEACRRPGPGGLVKPLAAKQGAAVGRRVTAACRRV